MSIIYQRFLNAIFHFASCDVLKCTTINYIHDGRKQFLVILSPCYGTDNSDVNSPRPDDVQCMHQDLASHLIGSGNGVMSNFLLMEPLGAHIKLNQSTTIFTRENAFEYIVYKRRPFCWAITTLIVTKCLLICIATEVFWFVLALSSPLK